MTTRRAAAKAPKPRTVTVTVTDGDFAGWSATARVDFPARLLADLQTNDVDRVLAALTRIITDHNMPDADGAIAGDLADVDPWTGVSAVAAKIGEAIASLPPR